MRNSTQYPIHAYGVEMRIKDDGRGWDLLTETYRQQHQAELRVKEGYALNEQYGLDDEYRVVEIEIHPSEAANGQQ